MKILVAIKQVPDMESRFRPNGAGTWFEETDLAWRMNEYDEFAVEQAVQIKEGAGNEPDVTIISIGPERIREAIKKGLAMGGDRGVLVRDDAAYEKSPKQIAAILASFAKDKGFDLVLTGQQSQDRGSAQVGVLLGEMLGIPAVTTIVDCTLEGTKLQVKRELEGGTKANIEMNMPALLTCQLGLNTPRYPTLPNIMKAKKKELLEVDVATLNAGSESAKVVRFAAPEKKGGAEILEGDVATLADRLAEIIRNRPGLA